jgi:hypothetical protein
LIHNNLVEQWEGDIWSDKPPDNEDPFVFSEPWVYSYCHATELKRAIQRKGDYVEKGSYLIFCNGQAAEKGIIEIDTVMVVDLVARWICDPSKNHLELPNEFKHLFSDDNSILWTRHLKFPFENPPQHRNLDKGMYSYISKMWGEQDSDYSYLPLGSDGKRATFAINNLTNTLQDLINSKILGKRPVQLNATQLEEVRGNLEKVTITKVVRRVCEL